MSTLPTGYGDYRDPTDTAAWEHAVEMLTREAREWACPMCGTCGVVDGSAHAAGTAAATGGFAGVPTYETRAEVGMAGDGSPVWEFVCLGCDLTLEVDEDGTR